MSNMQAVQKKNQSTVDLGFEECYAITSHNHILIMHAPCVPYLNVKLKKTANNAK